MKTRLLLPLLVPFLGALSLVLLASSSLSSCSTTTEPEYTYQPSSNIMPDSVISNTDHKLNLAFGVETPQRGCWQLDYAGFGRDSDTVAKVRYVYVSASIKKLSTSTTCLMGYDTLHTHVVIPFDSAGTYWLDFLQRDVKDNLVHRRVRYTVQ